MYCGVEPDAAVHSLLAPWTRLDRAVDTCLMGLVIVDSFERPAAASLDLGRVLADDAIVVELVPLHQPLWRTVVGIGESSAVSLQIGSRGVEWRSLGLAKIEHWRCRSPRDLAVTGGTFTHAGEGDRRSNARL